MFVFACFKHVRRACNATSLNVYYKIHVVLDNLVCERFLQGTVHARFFGIGETNVDACFQLIGRHLRVKAGNFQQRYYAETVVRSPVGIAEFACTGTVSTGIVVSHQQHARLTFARYCYPQIFDVVGDGLCFVESVVRVARPHVVEVFLCPVVFFHIKPHVCQRLLYVQTDIFVRLCVEHGMRLFGNFLQVGKSVLCTESLCVCRGSRRDENASAQNKRHCKHYAGDN